MRKDRRRSGRNTSRTGRGGSRCESPVGEGAGGPASFVEAARHCMIPGEGTGSARWGSRGCRRRLKTCADRGWPGPLVVRVAKRREARARPMRPARGPGLTRPLAASPPGQPSCPGHPRSDTLTTRPSLSSTRLGNLVPTSPDASSWASGHVRYGWRLSAMSLYRGFDRRPTDTLTRRVVSAEEHPLCPDLVAIPRALVADSPSRRHAELEVDIIPGWLRVVGPQAVGRRTPGTPVRPGRTQRPSRSGRVGEKVGSPRHGWRPWDRRSLCLPRSKSIDSVTRSSARSDWTASDATG